VHGLIADAVRREPAGVVAERINAAGGLCQRIREMHEVWADPLLVARGLLGEVDDAELNAFPVPVASLAARGRTRLSRAPAIGEHSREVAADAGLTPDEIERLIAADALIA
jgi:crotonobetainyl-CoA:carnitine CoA-transferase CaiB-like acyl-CoA transferase